MAINKSNPLVVSIDRAGLTLCVAQIDQPLRLNFAPTQVNNLEILDRPQLVAALSDFIQKNHLTPAPIIFVISETIYFDKDFPLPDPPTAAAIQEFVDSIPFTTPSSKVFTTENGVKLIVINRDLYDAIRQPFESAGFAILAVVPGFILGQIGVSVTLDSAACHVIYKKTDLLVANSFSTPIAATANFTAQKQQFIQKNKTWLVIASIAAILICLATAFYVFTRRPKSLPTNVQPTRRLIGSPSPIGALPSQLTVSIVSASSSSNLVQLATNRLTNLGLTQIQASSSARVAVSQPQIIFSTVPSVSLRQQIISSLSEIIPNLASQVGSNTLFDIQISLP